MPRWFDGAHSNATTKAQGTIHTHMVAPQMGHLIRTPHSFDVIGGAALLYPQWVVPEPVEAGARARSLWAVSDWDAASERDLGFHLWEAAEEDHERRAGATGIQACFRRFRARRARAPLAAGAEE